MIKIAFKFINNGVDGTVPLYRGVLTNSLTERKSIALSDALCGEDFVFTGDRIKWVKDVLG